MDSASGLQIMEIKGLNGGQNENWPSCQSSARLSITNPVPSFRTQNAPQIYGATHHVYFVSMYIIFCSTSFYRRFLSIPAAWNIPAICWESFLKENLSCKLSVGTAAKQVLVIKEQVLELQPASISTNWSTYISQITSCYLIQMNHINPWKEFDSLRLLLVIHGLQLVPAKRNCPWQLDGRHDNHNAIQPTIHGSAASVLFEMAQAVFN